MKTPAIPRLLLAAAVWFHAVSAGAGAQVLGQRASPARHDRAVQEWPTVIITRRGASDLESLAANEVRRYVYLRTGKLLPVKQGLTSGNRIVVSRRDSRFCGDLGEGLACIDHRVS